MIKVTLPYTGDISVNKYKGRRKDGGDYILESARIWGLCLRGAINSQLHNSFDPQELDPTHPFDLLLEVHFPRRFSKVSGDSTNFDKFIRDIVAETLGVNDAGTSFLPGSPSATYANKGQSRIVVGVETFGYIAQGEVCLVC